MSVARNTGYNLAGAIVPIAVGLLVLPLYLRAIGVERYGLLALFLTISTSLSFLSLGLGPAVTQRIASLTGQSTAGRSRLIWSALFLSLIAAALGSAAWLALGDLYFDHFAKVSDPLRAEVDTAMPFVALSLGLNLLGAPLGGALQGRQRFFVWNLLQAGLSILGSVAPLVVAWLVGPELPRLVATASVIVALGLLLQFLVARRLVPIEQPVRPDLAELKGLARFGGWMTLIAFVSPLVLMADRLIIGAVRGPAQVAAYAIPYNLVQRLILVPSSFTGAAMPHLAAGGRTGERALQTRSIEALTALLTPMAIVAVGMLGPFLEIWIGPSLASAATVPGIILTVGFWIHGVSHVPSTILLGRGTPAPIAILLLALVVPYLALAYFMTLHFGITGAALAWLARVAFDPFLFLITRPERAAMLRLAGAGMLVGLGAILAVFVAARQPAYIGGIAISLALSLWLYREFWIDPWRRLLSLRATWTKGALKR